VNDVTVRIVGPVSKRLESLYRKRQAVGPTRLSIPIGTVDANSEGRFYLKFVMPSLDPGTYWLVAEPEAGPPFHFAARAPFVVTGGPRHE
jgi:hypothetical protein